MTSGDVESPCNLVCAINPKSGWCLGCYRTLDEIARWGGMTNDQRRTVLEGLCDRAASSSRIPANAGTQANQGQRS